jgi:hypothetical protein
MDPIKGLHQIGALAFASPRPSRIARLPLTLLQSGGLIPLLQWFRIEVLHVFSPAASPRSILNHQLRKRYSRGDILPILEPPYTRSDILPILEPPYTWSDILPRPILKTRYTRSSFSTSRKAALIWTLHFNRLMRKAQMIVYRSRNLM